MTVWSDRFLRRATIKCCAGQADDGAVVTHSLMLFWNSALQVSVVAKCRQWLNSRYTNLKNLFLHILVAICWFLVSLYLLLLPLSQLSHFSMSRERKKRGCKCVGTALCLWSRLPPGHAAEVFETPWSLAAFRLLSLFLPFFSPPVIAPLFQRTKPALSGHSERFIKTRNGVIVNRHPPPILPPPSILAQGTAALCCLAPDNFWERKGNNSLWRLK